MNKIREMVSFELAKTLTKMFSLLSLACDKGKISSRRVERQNFGFCLLREVVLSESLCFVLIGNFTRHIELDLS